MRRILLSLITIAAVGGLAFGATQAFFSDTETSEGNRLEAGIIDLQIDNDSYAIDWNIPNFTGTPSGNLVASTNTSWSLRDLTVEKFFNFVDLKPGDYGEDTISVHVGTNDAWLCAAAQVTEDNDNTFVDPELADDQTTNGDPKDTDGELDEQVNFAFWIDDGDNVFENDEEIFLQGPISGLGGAGQMALADSQSSVLGGNTPVSGDTTFYIGKYWCFGDMATSSVPNDLDTDPVTRGTTGFTCNGADVGNAAQTDIVTADLEFYAEQSRNNGDFVCSSWDPSWI